MTKRRLTFLIFSGAVLIGLLFVLLRIPGRRPDPPPAAPPSFATGDAAEAESGFERESASHAAGPVRVVDADGRPCRAAVYAMGLAGRPPDRADHIGDTGEDGRLLEENFQLKPRGEVFARTPDRVAPPVTWDPAGIELVLGDGVVVTGTVTGKDGAPVTGALIKVGSGYDRVVRTATDRQGKFRLTGLYPGTWEISAVAGGCSTGVAVEVETWSGELRADLTDMPLRPHTALVEVTYSEPPQAYPLLRIGKGERPTKLWLPPENALVLISPGEGETELEALCPGFRSATARITEVPSDGEPAARLMLVAGGGLPRSILVVGGDGRPVPNALLLLTSNARDYHPDTAWTGPDGRYPVHAGLRDWLVVASAKEGASERTQIRDGTDEVRLLLRPGATITGRIVDRATGEGVADTLVRLGGGDCLCCSPWNTRTDSLGEYRFEGIPAGSFVQPWVAGSPGVKGNMHERPNSHAEAVHQGRGHLARGDETARMADIPVDRHPFYECRLHVAGGIPGEAVVIKDARVGDGASTYYRRFGDEAVVELTVDAGRRLFLLRSGGLRGTVWAEPGERSPVLDLSVKLAPPPKVAAVLVGVERKHLIGRNHWIDVEVAHRNGQRIAGGGSKADWEGRADLTGEVPVLDSPDFLYVIDLNRGSLRLTKGPLRFTGAELAAMIRKSPGELVFELPVERAEAGPPRIPVVVVGLDGMPLAGVRIGDTDDDTVEAVTDAAGRAEISPWGQPLYPWFGEWNLPGKGSEETLRLTVEPARRLRLRLLDPDGEPLADRELWERGGSLWLDTDENGAAEVALPARRKLLVLDETQGLWFPPLDLTKVKDGATIRAVPLRTLAVVVEGPNALAVEREIGLFWSTGPAAGDATGSGELARVGDVWRGKIDVPPFGVSLRAVTSNLRHEARADLSAEVGEVRLTLKARPEHEVSFLFLGPDGAPLADLLLYADEMPYTAGALLPPRARTDGAGSFVFRVPEGAHVIEGLEAGECGLDELRFTSPADGVVEVRLAQLE